MKNVLIVGGAGYIGGYMTDLLLANDNYDVTVLDSLLYETRYLKKIKFINADIRDTKYLGSIINNYDVVIWLAAIVGDGACTVDSNLTEQVNFGAVKWLVDNYKGKIVFTSTCSIYGINNELLDEEAEPNPLSLYASTKLAAERYIVANAKDYLVFRLGTLYGMSDEHSRLRLDLVANILTLRAVMGETLKVFGGEQWRPLLHVRDVSHAVEYCLDNDINGIYNLSECNMTVRQLAEKIQEIIPNTQVEYQDMKFEDLRNYRVKNDKISAVGWSPKCSIDKGILETKQVLEQGRVKNVQDLVYSNANFVKYLHSGGKHGIFNKDI